MTTKHISPMELTTLLNRSKDSVLNLTIYEYRILSFLLARVNKDKLSTHGYLAWPGTDQITEFTGISKSTIERSRASMVKAGWMQYTPGHGAGSSNHYYLSAEKIVSCYVASGNKRPEGLLYETRVQEKQKKVQERNTTGLLKGKEKPNTQPAPKPELKQDEAPRVNPDGSPPYWPNGESRYSWNEVMPKSSSAIVTQQGGTTYTEEDCCPF